MGAKATIPKIIENTNSKDYKMGVLSIQGNKEENNDSILTNMDLGDGNSLFVVFSGRGGEHVAALAKKHFVDILRKKGSYVKKNYEKALEMTFVELD